MKSSLFIVGALMFTLLTSSFSFGQDNYTLLLRNGNIELPMNSSEYINQFDISSEKVYNRAFYKLVQFNAIPSTGEQEKMRAIGFNLLEYIPHKAWIVSVSSAIDIKKLYHFNIRSISNLDNFYKLHPDLYNQNFPTHALHNSREIELVVVRHKNTGTNEVVLELKGKNFEVLEHYPESRNIRLIASTKQITTISALPFVSYVEVVAPPAEPEDTRGRSLHRANAISTSPFYGAGRKYDGTGVKVAVNDDGFVGPHIDYTGRIDNSEVASDFTGTHGDGVAGIVGAAGNLDPSNAGMATGVFQKIRQYSSSLPNTVNLHVNEQIMMFNSSYSNGTNAGYTSTTQLVDNEIYNNPNLIQIFSAGNSNGQGSTAAGSQWFNITGGHKAGKNVIATANLYYDDVLVSSSSRGPAHDGRIKPDIASNGQNQISTAPDNAYMSFGGTSGAAPGIMGCAAQLYHAYKDLNGGTNPPSALIKAALINTAYDLGNAGPDFKYGWGRINALRALRLIEQNRYLSSSISNGGVNTHNIIVPANCSQLRVMVYWADPAGAVGTNKALVNDIDITLDDPILMVNNLPLVLDPTPNATTLDLPAVQGVDTLNNVEQVRIENPGAGSYTLNVSGTSIPTGPQTYWVVYEFILNEIEVTYPIGGESFARGETEALRWDAHGTSGNFTLEYSADNGVTWSTISTSISGSARFYNWTVPPVVTGDALIRVSRGSNSDTSEDTFSILDIPGGLAVDFACPDSIRLIWNAVSGATSYEVSQLGAMYMDSIGTSTTTSFIVTGLNPNDEHWFSVRAKANGIEGRRALAIKKDPGTFFCPIPFDGAILNFEKPNNTQLTNCDSLSIIPIEINIANEGLNSISNFDVSYRLNGGTIVIETIAGPLAPLSQLLHTFSSTIDLSVSGSYQLEAWIDVTSDGNTFNDTSSITLISGGIQTLPFTENFESFSTCATASDCELTICNLGNGFINIENGEGDDIDWRTDAGGTPSSGTGPSVDHNPGTSGGKYLYTEVSGSPVCATKTAMMVSPCIDLTGTNSPELKFWYHMEGTAMGSLHIDIYSGGTWTNDVISAITGSQGANWLQATVNLTPYINQIINFRIRGITGSNWSSDIAIDDISVLETSTPPVVSFSADFTETCIFKTVQFTDNSINNPTSWNWSFNPNTITFVNGTNVNSQNPQVQFNALGSYDVTLTATNGFGNDSQTQFSFVNVNAVTGLPISEDFQTSFPPASWSLVPSPGGLNWISANVIGSGGASTDAAYVNNYANNFPGQESAIYSMPVDLVANGLPVVIFDVAYAPYDANFNDGLRVDVSADCGVSFIPSGYFKQYLDLATVPAQTSNFVPSSAGDWRTDTVDLSAFAGIDINISFVNINGYGNGLYIDNIMIEDLCDGYNLCTWTGAIDNDWNKEGNWICGIPTITKDVIIPNGSPNCIIYSGQSGICKTIIVENGASLIIQTDGNLELK